MNGGSIRWEPMEWLARNFIGGALLRLCCAYFIMCSPWWTGDLSLWMISAGFCGNPWQNHSHVPSSFSGDIWVPIELEEDGAFTGQELDSALGRLQWATNRCPLTKPFLQTFWQRKSAVKSSGRPKQTSPGVCSPLPL